MPTPSLLIVPSRWKTGNPGKLYSQIPTNGNGDFNVTGVVTGGTSIGTRVNNLGYIERITTSGTPRLDYYTSSGTPGCPALLVEPAATNICLQSEAIGITSWVNTAVTASPNVSATLDPSGGNTAEKIIATAVSGAHFTTRAASTQTGQHTFSVFAKAAEYSFIRLQDLNAGRYNVWYDLVSGTANGTGTSIQNYGNGWYRCIITYDGAGANVANSIIGVPTSGGGNSYTGDGVSGIYVWGAQLETGSVATSYIPTTTGTVTRAADVISVSGAVSGSIGQTEGTIYAEVDVRNLGFTRSYITVQDSSFLNNAFRIEQTAANQWRVQIRVANTSALDRTILTPTITAGIYKIAFAYNTAASGTVFAVNGTIISTDTVASMPTGIDRVILGTRFGAGDFSLFFNDRIRAAALYTTRLTNADLMLLTMPGNNTYLPQAVWNNYLSRAGNTEVPDCLYTRHADLLDV